MRELCVIGNSHIAALKLGWETIRSDFPDVQLFFFGAPGRKMVGLTAVNQHLEPTDDIQRRYFRQTSGGRESIHANYDAYLFHAMQFGITRLEWFLSRERPENQKHDDRRPISDACFYDCVLGILRGTTATQTIAELRKITSAPATLTPQAMPSEDQTDSTLAHLDSVGDAATVRDIFAAAASMLAREFDFAFLPQSPETLAGPCKTKRQYCTGSVALAGGGRNAHPQDDYQHMNAEYGALLLRAWLVGTTASLNRSGCKDQL